MARNRPRLSSNVAAVLVLGILAGALLLWQRPWEASTGDRTTPIAVPGSASSLLSAQLRAMSSADSERAFVAAAGTSRESRAFSRRTWNSLKALGVTDLSIRYLGGGDVADRADGSAAAAVDVSWRAGPDSGLDPTTVNETSVSLRVAPQADGTLSIVSASPDAKPMPIWLVGKIVAERGAGSTVLTVDGGDAELAVDSMVAAARLGVTRVVPGATGQVTAVSPRTQAQMAQIVGQDVGAVAQIAAVATRLGTSSTSPDAAVIVLNPAVFATMDQRAAQVVLTHETTHVLTRAVGTRAETWVVEGFADFVALHDDTAPLSVSAGQILREVKAGKRPQQLPDATDFASTEHGLGAVYESAWMIFRLLAQEYGDAKVVSFYDSVIGGAELESALKKSFGLTVARLTSDWQDYLTKSASTVS